MNCPICLGRTRVQKVMNTLRIRICLSCGLKFQTEEVPLRRVK